MPEVTPEVQASEDLDQKVESLLKQMEDAAQRAAAIAAETEADPAPPGEAGGPTDLAAQVDQLLAEASESAAERPQTIGSLDDELARLASELIEGEVEAAPPPPPAIHRTRAAEAQVSAMPPAAAVQQTEKRREAAEPPVAAVPSKPTRPPLWRRAAAGIARCAVGIARAICRHTPTLIAYLEPVAFRLASLVSAPLRTRPALVRDAVGWVALGTMFWASCLFAYFLFLYEPEPPRPTSAAVGLVDPSGPESGHGEAAAHEPKAEAPKEHAKESDGHGGGEKPEAKKASPLKRPDRNPLGTPAKKPEKPADGSHGSSGGH